MLGYSEGFYSLMNEAGIKSARQFDAYIENILEFGDTQNLFLEGFEYEPEMQLDFTYEQIQLETNLKLMATYVDKDSDAIPFGTRGFESTKGSIPRQKTLVVKNENDWRKYLITKGTLGFQNMTTQRYALNLLFRTLKDITDGHETSMTYQRDQMVSSGKFTLRDDNNPRGIRNITFSAQIPTENIKSLTGEQRWFTDTDKQTTGSTSNPVEDVKRIIRDMKRKGFMAITIEVDEVSFLEDMEHPKWREQMGVLQNPLLRLTDTGLSQAEQLGRLLGDEAVKDAFRKITGATVIFRNNIAAVEKTNPATGLLEIASMRSFNPNVYVFYPTGNIGTIKVVAPLRPDTSAIYGTILGGKGLIEYTYKPEQKIQRWWSELTALCVPNISKEMYYLHIK